MAPSDRPYTTFYWSVIVTIARSLKIIETGTIRKLWCGSYSPFIVTMTLSCIVCEIHLLVENREIFIPYLYLAAPQVVTPNELSKSEGTRKAKY